MLRTLGADLVGMSTALEAIAAHAAGVEVFGLSLVTNAAAGVTGEKLDHRRGDGGRQGGGRPARRVPGRVHRAAAVSGLVLVTGAAGADRHLAARRAARAGWAVRCLDVVPVPDERPGEEQLVADVTDLAAMVDAIQGVAAVVHLAGVVGESTWPAISHANIEGTYSVLEAARRAGVQRVVLASSNHASGFTPRPADGLLREADAPPRPDTYYGVAQGGDGGARARSTHDRYGHGRRLPADRQRLPRADDARAAGHLALPRRQRVPGRRRPEARPRPGFSVVWGVSDNTRQLVGPHRRAGRWATSRSTTPRSTPRR